MIMKNAMTTLISVLSALVAVSCGDNLTLLQEHEAYQPDEIEPLECLPNLDGKIESSELPVVFDNPVSYLVSPAGEQRTVDLLGDLDDQGHRIWDWGADYASDQLARLTAMQLSVKWYSASFPAGQFVACFDAGCQIEAVYSQDENGFYLLGLASATENPIGGQTLLAYSNPVTLYRLPIQSGDDYVSVGEIANGTFQGLPYAGRDTYEIRVDGSGILALPDLTFTQVLRVRTHTVLEPAVGQSTSQRQVSFLFECFGEVARATSLPGESEENFTTAAEVRRLGL